MKYQVLLIVLMLVLAGCSHDRSAESLKQPCQTDEKPTIRLGMSHQSALEIIRDCGGEDITRGQAIQGPNGERPDDGLYWDLAQYNAVLEIGAKDGLVSQINYWTSADFSKSKNHREETRKIVKSVTFEKQANLLRIEQVWTLTAPIA